MSKKIVFFSTPAYGHIISVLPVIKELVKLHKYCIDWYCTNQYKSIIESTGANFIEYPEHSPKNINKEKQHSINFYSLAEIITLRDQKYFLYYYDLIKSNKPDLIIYDSLCSFGRNLSKKLDIKSVCFCTTKGNNFWVSMFVYKNISLKRNKTYKDRIKALKINNNKFLEENGIPKPSKFDLFFNPGDMTLIFSPKEYPQFAKTFPKSVHFVGTTIKERKEMCTKKYDKYNIYVALGTILTESDLLNEIADSDVVNNNKTIMSVGKKKMKENNNITFVERTEQLSLLDNCDLFINHGGLNSVYEAIYSGVPQICIPQTEEQRITAKLVNKNGLGLYLEYFDDKKVSEFIKKKDLYIKNIKKHQKLIRSYDGTKTSVKLINNMLEK